MNNCAVITQLCFNSTMIPQSQKELIRAARGSLSQAEFAKELQVDRSCLSRYENEALGAPTSVINYCLASLAQTIAVDPRQASPIAEALSHAREAVAALERLGGGDAVSAQPNTSKKVRK